METQTTQSKYPTRSKKKYLKKNLLNENEIAFYEKLKKGLKGLQVFPQVSMNGVLNVANQKGFNDRIPFASKIIDFVVCTPSYQILAMVELDGPSHDSPEEKEKDNKRDTMLKDAGYLVIRYDWRNEITEIQLNQDFKKIINAWNVLKLQEEAKRKEKAILRALAEVE